MSTKPTRRQRTIAGLVDAALLGTVGLLYVRDRRQRGLPADRTVSAVVAATYVVVPVAVFGATPGQLVAGLRVVDTTTHRPVGWRQALLRWTVWSGPTLAVNVTARRLRGRLTALPLVGLVVVAIYHRRLGEDGVDRITKSTLVSIR